MKVAQGSVQRFTGPAGTSRGPAEDQQKGAVGAAKRQPSRCTTVHLPPLVVPHSGLLAATGHLPADIPPFHPLQQRSPGPQTEVHCAAMRCGALYRQGPVWQALSCYSMPIAATQAPRPFWHRRAGPSSSASKGSPEFGFRVTPHLHPVPTLSPVFFSSS